jgi:transcriptional regulator with XRE-family HTH domain
VLGHQIRELREARCWSQAHLADAAALNVRTVQRIEAGEACSYETMMSLAAALGIDVAILEPGAPAKRELAFSWRLGVAGICLLPLLLFVALNLLRTIIGISAPYDAIAAAGIKIMSFRTFNLLSPAIFVGGGLAALVVAGSSFLRIRSKNDGSTVSITALELTGNWAAICVALAASACLAVLLSYAALEQLFTAIH